MQARSECYFFFDFLRPTLFFFAAGFFFAADGFLADDRLPPKIASYPDANRSVSDNPMRTMLTDTPHGPEDGSRQRRTGW